ncbi:MULTISPECIES: hypothetical protein [Lysinibacillus]|uniref:hypothetical protein n=1 Tax=Lysinibacillus TaxID=400634 RepID=UPI00237DF0EF|nr:MULTISPECIES: hypothetical protein [Lysinibacillus]WDU79253.1 hypothetical protein PSR12_21985 [Lysinibacillus sp. G01H]
MIDQTLTCKACGSSSFAIGELGHGYANIRPVNKRATTGSPVLLTYCQDCGEIASMKVKEIGKLKKW